MTEKKGASPEAIIRDIKRKTRRKFTAEENIRIVLEGMRGEALIALQKIIFDCFAGRFRPAGKSESMTFARLADSYIDDYAKVKKRSWKTDYYLSESSMKPFFGATVRGDPLPRH